MRCDELCSGCEEFSARLVVSALENSKAHDPRHLFPIGIGRIA